MFFRHIRFYFLCAILAVSFTSLAHAESNIGVVDVRFILTQSEASKSLIKQREDMQAAYLKEISKTEQTLRSEEQALVKEREKLSSEDFLAKKQEYERKLLEAGRSAREKKQKLDTLFSKGMDKVKSKLTEIVQKIAEDKGYELVITKQNVITGAASVDMTEEAIKQLNDAMSSIKLED